jgi:hypothetical protein
MSDPFAFLRLEWPAVHAAASQAARRRGGAAGSAHGVLSRAAGARARGAVRSNSTDRCGSPTTTKRCQLPCVRLEQHVGRTR